MDINLPNFSGQCEAILKRTGTRCSNIVMGRVHGLQSRYCARHIERDKDSLYTRCMVSFSFNEKKKIQHKRCGQIVLKKFGYCEKHFDYFLKSLNSQEKLWETIGFLNSIISLLVHDMPNCEEEEEREHCNKNVNKFQSMRLKTLQHLNVPRSTLNEQSEHKESNNFQDIFCNSNISRTSGKNVNNISSPIKSNNSQNSYTPTSETCTTFLKNEEIKTISESKNETKITKIEFQYNSPGYQDWVWYHYSK